MNAPELLQSAAMRRLWERMVAIYGYRWASAYGEAAEDSRGLTLAAETWQRGLSGVTPRQIGAGVSACIASADPWPPTLPAFRAFCLGVPSFHVIHSEWIALPRSASLPSPFLRLVLQCLEAHKSRLRLMSAEAAEKKLREGYDAARERFMRGEPLPEAPAALVEYVEPVRTPATPETVAAAAAVAKRVAGAHVDGEGAPA